MITVTIIAAVVLLACIFAYVKTKKWKKEAQTELPKEEKVEEKKERARDPKTGRFIKRT